VAADPNGAVRLQEAEGDLTVLDGVDARLAEHRRIWDSKPTLRVVYADYHRRLEAACPPGPLLDIGGGSPVLPPWRLYAPDCPTHILQEVENACENDSQSHDGANGLLPVECGAAPAG
jgi:hypothetical protein